MTVLLGCCTCFCILSVCTFALTAGIVLGYNYSVSEFQQTKTPNVTLRISKGALEDKILVARRKMNQALQAEEDARKQGLATLDVRDVSTEPTATTQTGTTAETKSPSKPMSMNEALAQRQYENYIKRYGYQHPAKTLAPDAAAINAGFGQAPKRTTLYNGAKGWTALNEREKNIQPWKEINAVIQDDFNQKMLRANQEQLNAQEMPQPPNQLTQIQPTAFAPVMMVEPAESGTEGTTMHPWNEYIANQQYENFWHKFTSSAPPEAYEATVNEGPPPPVSYSYYQRSIAKSKDATTTDEPEYSVTTAIANMPTRVSGEPHAHDVTRTTLEHYVLRGKYETDITPVRTTTPELYPLDTELYTTNKPEKTKTLQPVWMRFPDSSQEEAMLHNAEAPDEEVVKPYQMREPPSRFPVLKTKITSVPHLKRLTTRTYEDYDEAKGDRMPLRKKRENIRNNIIAKYILDKTFIRDTFIRGTKAESTRLLTSKKEFYNNNEADNFNHIETEHPLFEEAHRNESITTTNQHKHDQNFAKKSAVVAK